MVLCTLRRGNLLANASPRIRTFERIYYIVSDISLLCYRHFCVFGESYGGPEPGYSEKKLKLTTLLYSYHGL